MGTVTYQPNEPEAASFEQLRKANAESTRAARAKEVPQLPDRKPASKPAKE